LTTLLKYRAKLNERIEKKDRTKEWEEDIGTLKKKCAKLGKNARP
jgi:molybdopterin converting factor small subunit